MPSSGAGARAWDRRSRHVRRRRAAARPADVLQRRGRLRRALALRELRPRGRRGAGLRHAGGRQQGRRPAVDRPRRRERLLVPWRRPEAFAESIELVLDDQPLAPAPRARGSPLGVAPVVGADRPPHDRSLSQRRPREQPGGRAAPATDSRGLPVQSEEVASAERCTSRPTFTHLDDSGRPRMVDVSDKAVTDRASTARGEVRMRPETLAAIRDRRIAKGDVLATAQVAGRDGSQAHLGDHPDVPPATADRRRTPASSSTPSRAGSRSRSPCGP